MSLSGAISQIQRERDKPYIYMPNPTLIHPRSVKLNHYLKMVDFFIHAGMPKDFLLEPVFGEYRPDAYMRDSKGNPICVEMQLTPISTKKMQTKLEQFVGSFRKEHDAKVMILCSDSSYDKVKIPEGFHLIRLPIPKEPYEKKKESLVV